jgi:hypothetical protein
MTKMPQDGPHGYDAPLVRLLDRARWIQEHLGRITAHGEIQIVLLAINAALLGLILWRVW